MKNISLLLVALVFMVTTIEVKAQCTASFDTTSNGLTVNFINQSTGNFNYIEYDFGDGNYSAYVANPSHTYASPGVYPVCMYIIDTINFQCFAEYCDTLFIGGATCGALWDFDTDQLDVEFYSDGLGTYDSLWWDFGDGNGSNDEEPFHSYASEGNYTVCLSLFDNGTLCDSSCYTIYVTDEDCEADFSYDTDGLDVDFYDESNGSYNAVYWDFGDGFGFSEDPDPSYTYFSGGTYEVCLYIYDSIWGSCEDEICMFVTVSGGGGGGGCEADYSYNADQLEVSFTNLSSGGLFSTWDFGDGSTPSFEENPVHAFATPGEYEVCVSIVNPFPFCTDTYCEFVEVVEYTCEPEFSYSFNESNAFTFFNNTTIGEYTSIEWDFGDGNTSSFEQPTYTYNIPGVYTVCLTTFEDGFECGKTCKEVGVYTLGTEEFNGENIVIAPNPNTGQFSIDLPSATKDLDIEILDLSGRLVHQQSESTSQGRISINTALPSGAYFVKLTASNSSEAILLKMMVQ